MRKLAILFVLFIAAATASSQETSKIVPPLSDAKLAFEKLKTLAGTWHGVIMGRQIDITIRPASSDTTILHEANTDKGPPDHEITMFYIQDDRLMATHYCDAGNRARFEGKLSADGKTVDFTFIDVSGSTRGGLVKHMTFTIVDANTHTILFTFIMPNGKSIDLPGEFRRTK